MLHLRSIGTSLELPEQLICAHKIQWSKLRIVLVLAVHLASLFGSGGKCFVANSDNFIEDWNGNFIIVKWHIAQKL